MVLDTIAQFGMLILGVAAITLVAHKSKWGFVVGLCSQPFFFISSYLNGQWGLFILSFFYTGSWLYGIYMWFYRHEKPKKK
jgi:nicotinamide riboside transporter PnuC